MTSVGKPPADGSSPIGTLPVRAHVVLVVGVCRKLYQALSSLDGANWWMDGGDEDDNR